MALISPSDRVKTYAFRSPFSSGTVREYVDSTFQAARVISGLTVSSDGTNASIGDGTFIQRGIVVDVQNVPDVLIPATFPAVLVINNDDQKADSDVSVNFMPASSISDGGFVVLAEFSDATTFDQPPTLSYSDICRAPAGALQISLRTWLRCHSAPMSL